MDSVSARVDRVEGELEYLENKIPAQSDIEMEEALLEQQIKAAELEQIKTKAKLNVENGRRSQEGNELKTCCGNDLSSRFVFCQTAARL